MSCSDDFPSGDHTPIDPPLSIDPLLVPQTAVSKRSAEDVSVIPDDSGVDGRVGVRKRVRLSSDQDKAHLVRLCINNFGHYGQGREKFFRYIRQLFEAEKGAQSPDVRSWMSRSEDSRKKEIAEGTFYLLLAL